MASTSWFSFKSSGEEDGEEDAAQPQPSAPPMPFGGLVAPEYQPAPIGSPLDPGSPGRGMSMSWYDPSMDCIEPSTAAKSTYSGFAEDVVEEEQHEQEDQHEQEGKDQSEQHEQEEASVEPLSPASSLQSAPMEDSFMRQCQAEADPLEDAAPFEDDETSGDVGSLPMMRDDNLEQQQPGEGDSTASAVVSTLTTALSRAATNAAQRVGGMLAATPDDEVQAAAGSEASEPTSPPAPPDMSEAIRDAEANTTIHELGSAITEARQVLAELQGSIKLARHHSRHSAQTQTIDAATPGSSCTLQEEGGGDEEEQPRVSAGWLSSLMGYKTTLCVGAAMLSLSLSAVAARRRLRA